VNISLCRCVCINEKGGEVSEVNQVSENRIRSKPSHSKKSVFLQF
jgi:hypothetical protein